MKNVRLKYLFFAIFIIFTILFFMVVKPFIPAILTSVVLAYLFYPFYIKISKKMNKSLAAIIILILVLLIFIIPSFFAFEALFKESLDLYNNIKSSEFSPIFTNVLNRLIIFVNSESQSLIKSIPRFFVNSFITLFLFYYLLKDGEEIVKKVKEIIPLEKKHRDLVVNDFKRVTSAVVYGLILVGLIAAALGVIGFFIFKVPNPILWGFILFIVSMLPGVGNAVIWVPASILKIINHDYFNGIGLFLYGLIFISGVEMLIKPKLISYKSDIHPAIIVLGIFGGISFLGFIGLFFGPLILVTFITFLKHILEGD